MSRSLVVEGEPVCLMTYPRDAAGMRMPIVRAGMRFCCRYIPHLHAKRVLKQGVFDIGQQQFLMLLFMAETKLD